MESEMELHVMIKSVYGTEAVYPSCTKSKLLSQIAGQKTLTPHTIKLAKILGYKFHVEQSSKTI